MGATRSIVSLKDGRTLCYDDVGDPAGRPVIYLHGTPDSRLARHPDDALAAAAGVRLLAVDRPGYGGTSPLATDAAPAAFGDDVAALLDHLGLADAAVLGWSGGALATLHLASSAALAGRLTGATVVAGLVPSDAYADPAVRAAGAERFGLIEMAELVPDDEVADAAAAMMAPFPCDRDLAVEHQREQRTARDQRLLDAIPGAVVRMADALVEAVRNGLAGVEADVLDQIQPFGDSALARITLPVRLFYGAADAVTPAAFGEWYAGTLPRAELTIVPDAGHYLPFTHWPQVLAATP